MRAYYGVLPEGDSRIEDEYHRLFSEPPQLVALDIESRNLQDPRPIGIGIGTPEGHNWYFSTEDISLPWHLLYQVKGSNTRKLWHNPLYDLQPPALGRLGVDIDNIEDTAILLRLLNLPVAMEEASKLVGLPSFSIKEILKHYNTRSMMDVPFQVTAQKCCNDVASSMRLWQKYRPHVDSEMYELELTTTRILLHNSKRGIKVDEELVEQIYQEVNTSYVMLNDICQAQGFNPRAPQQLTYMLSSMGYWVPMDRKTHKLKGDKDTLKGINHPFAAAALAARQYSRLSSIMEKMRGRDRVYSQFKLDSATGRISSASMDGQPGYIQQHNLPTGRREGDIIPQAGPVRRVFVPDAWDKNSGLAWDSLEQPKFTRFDMSQVELRILAYLAQDQVMLRELNTVGGDIHSKTMRELGIFSRVMAKNMNFGVVYGGSPEVLRMFTGIQDLNLLAYYSQKIFNTYTEVKKWIDMMRIEGPRNGYVETLGGRKLSLAQAGKSGSERHVQNCAVNYPIQGTAAWIFKKVLKLLLEYMPIDEIILQVHDEGLLNGVQFVPGREIERITEIYTPIEVDYKPRWA